MSQMNHWKYLPLAIVLAVATTLLSQTGNTGTEQQQAKKKTVHASASRNGEQIFQQNCSRCHNAPESFSPSISGTIVRHMRVRAGLSKEDEQALLRFLNP